MSQVDPGLAQAEDHLQHGRWSEARRAVERVLAENPQHHSALTLAAVLAQREGKSALAIELLGQVARLQPASAQAHFNLGAGCLAAGQTQAAADHFRQAIECDATDAPSWAALGQLAARAGNWPQARQQLMQAVQLNGSVAAWHHDLAVTLAALGQHQQAGEHFAAAAALDPEHLASHLGRLQQEQRLRGAPYALPGWQALTLRFPQAGPAWYGLAEAYLASSQPAEALAACRQGQRLRPTHAPGWFQAALALRELDRAEESLSACRRAQQLGFDSGRAAELAGQALWDLGQFAAAEHEFARALALQPGRVAVQLNLASAQLIQEKFDQGWAHYAWRTQAEGFSPPAWQCPKLPWWDGSPRPAGRLLVLGEQGLGDEILFSTCLPDLLRHAGPVTWVCDPRLVRLLSRAYPEVEVVARQALPAPVVPHEVAARCERQVFSGSLPARFRRTLADFPRQPCLFSAEPAAVARWRNRLAGLGPGLKVGISWQGGVAGRERRLRSLPLEHWSALLAQPGVEAVCLQYGDCQAELAAFRQSTGLTVHQFPEVDPLVELDEFASLVSALDLVISVPNATVHLAGALGVSTWALVRFSPDWRWLAAGSRCPWYGSVGLIRQTAPGDWSQVIDRARAMLRDEIFGRWPSRATLLEGRGAARQMPAALGDAKYGSATSLVENPAGLGHP